MTRFTNRTIGVALTFTALAVALPNAANAQAADNYREAWEQIKKLSGTWASQRLDREDRRNVISYHVTGGEAVVFEEFTGKTPDGVREMATAYHLDVDDIVATHYCGAGNQPRMRAVSYDPHERVLRFDFWDITDLADPDAYYTTGIELYFADDDNVELRFRGTEAGVAEEEWQVHRLRRLTTRSHARSGTKP